MILLRCWCWFMMVSELYQHIKNLRISNDTCACSPFLRIDFDSCKTSLFSEQIYFWMIWWDCSMVYVVSLMVFFLLCCHLNLYSVLYSEFLRRAVLSCTLWYLFPSHQSLPVCKPASYILLPKLKQFITHIFSFWKLFLNFHLKITSTCHGLCSLIPWSWTDMVIGKWLNRAFEIDEIERSYEYDSHHF